MTPHERERLEAAVAKAAAQVWEFTTMGDQAETARVVLLHLAPVIDQLLEQRDLKIARHLDNDRKSFQVQLQTLANERDQLRGQLAECQLNNQRESVIRRLVMDGTSFTRQLADLAIERDKLKQQLTDRTQERDEMRQRWLACGLESLDTPRTR